MEKPDAHSSDPSEKARQSLGEKLNRPPKPPPSPNDLPLPKNPPPSRPIDGDPEK